MTSHTKRNFPQNLKISSKMSLFWLPISVILATFFELFPKKWPQGSRAAPKSAQTTPKWTPRVPEWSPRVPQWSPRVTPNPQKAAQMCPKGDKMDPPGATMEPQGHPKSQKDATRPSKAPLRHQNVVRGAKKTIYRHIDIYPPRSMVFVSRVGGSASHINIYIGHI